ncbi:MAG: hypothetical protein WCC10_06075 [Tumebacillaceae bacterium]
MKKVLLTILSLVVVWALVVGGLRALNPYPFMDKQERGVVAEVVHQFQGQGQLFGYADRGYNSFGQWNDNYNYNYYGGQRGWRGHNGFFGTLFAFVGHLLLLVAGWALWKRGGRVVRWIGGLMIVLAVWPLVQIALLVGLIYWIWRVIRKKKESVEDFEIAMPLDNPFPTSQHDSLDQWEAKTRRELNNKKEEE